MDTRQNLHERSDREAMLRDALAAAALYEGEFESIYLHGWSVRLLLRDERYAEAFGSLRQAMSTLDTCAFPSNVPGLETPERLKQNERARLLNERCRLYRRLGLLDQAGLDFLEVEAEERRLTEKGILPALISNFAFTRASLDVALGRWGALEEWIPPFTASRKLVPVDRRWLEYWLAQATFERDRDDDARVALARQRFEDLLGAEHTVPFLRSLVHLRLARIALHRREYDKARIRLDAALVAGEDSLPAEDRAHLAYFEALWARETDSGVSAARAEILTRWRALLDDWEATPPRPGGVGHLNYPNVQRILGEVLRVQLETAGPRAAFEELHASHVAGTLCKARRTAGFEPSTPVPRPGEVIATYLPTTEVPRLGGTHLFILEAGREVEHVLLPVSGEKLKRQISALQRLLRVSPRAAVAPPRRSEGIELLSRSLWEVLIPEELRESLARCPKLTICGADLLNHLPFEVLGTSPAQRLGLTHEISTLPALPFASQVATPTQHATSFSLLSGGEALDMGPGWRDELTGWYRDGHSLHGTSAGEEGLRQASSQVLQLFGHGRLDVNSEMMVRIELDGGLVGYPELLACEEPPRVALITACGSWRGPLRAGDGGVGHLASALLRRGTEAVVVADADVEAGATLAWSEVFHWSLSAGASPARAALEARRALAASETYADPFYHSLLHVVGAGHRPAFVPPLRESAGPPPAPRREGSFAWVLGSAIAGGLLLAIALVVRLRGRT